MSFEEWSVFLKQRNAAEMRTLVTLKDALAPLSDGDWVDNPSTSIKKSTRKALLDICNNIQYKNVLWMRGEDLAEAMSVSVSSLTRILESCGGNIAVGNRKGGIGPYAHSVNAGYRVAINPMYAFRWYAPEDCGKKDLRFRFWFDRMYCMKDWMDMVLDKQRRSNHVLQSQSHQEDN